MVSKRGLGEYIRSDLINREFIQFVISTFSVTLALPLLSDSLDVWMSVSELRDLLLL